MLIHEDVALKTQYDITLEHLDAYINDNIDLNTLVEQIDLLRESVKDAIDESNDIRYSGGSRGERN